MRRGLALAATVVALLALHAVLSRSMDGFLLADGTGYLANARWIAGEAGDTWQGPAAFYNAGWSLLVAPIYLVTRSPGTVYDAVLALNAVLASVAVVAYAALGRVAFALTRPMALLAGIVAATYPAVLLQASFEWSESLFHLLFPLLLLAAWWLVTTGRIAAAATTGVLAAALNATHPKGLAAVVAIGVALVVLGVRGDISRRAAAVGVGALVVAFGLTRMLHGALQDALYAETAAAIEGDVIGRITDPALVWGTFQRLWGQLWYLTVASVGLFLLGVVHTARHRERRFAAIMLGTALVILGASCLQMSDGTRVDHMVYGRYVEGFLPAFLVAGAAGAVTARARVVRLAAVGAGAFVALGAMTLLFNGTDRFTGSVMPLNVVGVLAYRTNVDEIDVVAVTALALLPLAVAAVAARRTAAAGLAVVAAFFVGSSLSVEARTLRPWEDFWSATTEIPEVVRRIGYEGDVAYDLTAYHVDAADLYQLELTDIGDLDFFDSRHERPPRDLVIAGPTWRHPGARLLFVENEPFDQALWVLPGPLQDELDGEGLLIPEETSSALAVPQQRAELRVEDDLAGLRAGQRRRVDVEVANLGGTWLPAGRVPAVVDGTVRLGARWFDGDVEVASQTAELPRMLLPGDRATLTLELVAPEEPGRYRLVVSLRQESVSWWDASASTIDVVVR